METTCQEKDQATSTNGGALKLDVLLMHEDLPAGLRGKQALDHVAERLELKTEFCLHLWKFDLLKEPKLRQQALADARRANIVVLAVHGCAALPRQIRSWLKQWLQSRFDVPCALVVSLDASARKMPPSHPVLHYARAVAGPAGVDLFPHYSDTPQAAWNWTAQKPQPAGLAVWMEEILYLPEAHAACGINE